MRKWKDLPDNMRNDEVGKYYYILMSRRKELKLKRAFDLIVSAILLLVLSPIFILIGFAIKLDSPGAIFFRQPRVTQYGKVFRIYKFRTMVENAEKLGAQVTTKSDVRVTGVGKTLRKYRLDELPQLINILIGDMTFVGVRPEVIKYVEYYTKEMRATLLLPAGVTSEASIMYKDEEKLMADAADADLVYINKILPEKMKYNLRGLKTFSFYNDIKTMFKTVIAVLR